MQLMSARAGVRSHNSLQTKVALAGGKPEFIDVEAEKMLDEISRKNKESDNDDSAERAIVSERLSKKIKKKE